MLVLVKEGTKAPLKNASHRIAFCIFSKQKACTVHLNCELELRLPDSSEDFFQTPRYFQISGALAGKRLSSLQDRYLTTNKG